MSAMGILTELACHVVGDALVQAPSTKVAADRRVGEAVSREVRGFDAGAGMKADLRRVLCAARLRSCVGV